MAVDLAAKVQGEGPPLVVLHGLFGLARNWATLAKRFGENRTVHALDLRNHGGSPWSDTMTYEAMAEDVGAYIEANDLGEPAVVGHSMGGKAAMLLALETPSHVGPLVVADIAPVTYDHDFMEYVEAMRSVDLEALESRSAADAALKAAIPDPGVRSFLLLNLGRGDSGFEWQVNIDAIADAMEEITGFPDTNGAAFEGPTLFIAGGASNYIEAAHKPEIARRFPAAEHEVIEGAGHWLHAEAQDAFYTNVIRFLDAA